MNTAVKTLVLGCRLALAVLLPLASAWAQVPQVGSNVNMVSGTRFPEGDWNLTKQNEVSLAVSSRNPRHLLGGSNDYRLVLPDTAEGLRGAKAWVSLYKSVDGGTSWFTTIPGGCPLSIPQCNDATGLTAPLKALAPDFSADPTVRAGPYGTFFYSFIAGTRATSTDGAVAIQRFVDKNDDIQRAFDVRTVGGQDVMKPPEDPIVPDSMWIVDTGVKGQFVDKPWNVADVPGRPWNVGQPKCDLLAWTRNPPAGVAVRNVAEQVDPFNVYVSFANFAGQGSNDHPSVFVARSRDCGTTFGKPVKVSNSLQASQGTQLAVDPLSGTVYVVWRVFADVSTNPPKPDAIYISKSSDGGNTWLNQPVLIATINSYDQDAAGGAFRTLGFPTIAVSVQNGISRVHVAWAQRKAKPSTTAPFACTSANPADCDARIVMSTSSDAGLSWPAAVAVDGAFADPLDASKPGRGHQVQPAMAFTGGKLMLTWLDQRFDHTEQVLTCPTGAGACTSRREAKGNLVPNCAVDVSGPEFATLAEPYKSALAQCRAPYMSKASDAVWTTFLTDGTPGLVRRHTIDVFAAMADPGAAPVFGSSAVSRYTFGSTAQADKGVYDIRQKEFNAPNLPMFVNGTAAFLGDYIDVAGAAIVATGDTLRPYKYDVGCAGAACGNFTTGGSSPVFHIGFTDNRNVIPPIDGDWTRKTCLTTEFTTDSGGAPNGITNFGVSCNFAGAAGNRNQNVFSAVVAENAVAFANANSKRIGNVDPRGFVVTVENLTDTTNTYQLTLKPAATLQLGFDKQALAAPGTAPPPLTLTVQPRSSSTRSVWVQSGSNDDRTPITVAINGVGNAFQTQVLLNPDPAAAHVGNGDGNGLDLANNDLGSVVLSNAVLSNNVLTNAVLDDPNLDTNALSNNALTNAALSNVVLSNAVLSNLQVENLTPSSVALSNDAVTNAVLSNVVLSNAVLSNDALINAALSNAVLSNAVLSNVVLSNAALADITSAVLSNNALSNVALSNIDPANVALSNAVLSNNALSNAVLSNNALSNAVLSNDTLTNAALSNVVLSNAALSNAVLSNAVLSNNVLSNAVLSNAALTDLPDALSAVEQANFDLSNNSFVADDLSRSTFNFADASFTVRNRGNTDTTLAVKLLLRDSTQCDPVTHVCALPDGVKLQLVLRKIALTPSAIAPTPRAVDEPYDPITGAGRALRIGLTQTNAQVSNVGTPVIVDPADPDLGRFLPQAPDAATLPLSPGERAYVTLRAIGTPASSTNPFEFLRWGSKFVVVDASSNTRTRIPLVIRTLALPVATALQAAQFPFKAAGGAGNVVGTAVCADRFGSPLTDAARCLPPATVDFSSPAGTRDGMLRFTPNAKGDFYLLVTITDESVPAQEDRQLLKVVVDGAAQTVVPALQTLIPSGTIEFGKPVLLKQPTSTASGEPVVYSASGACTVTGPDAAGAYLLTPTQVSPPDCVVTASVAGNTVYATLTVIQAVTIAKGSQTIALGPLGAHTFGDAPFAVTASATSGLPVTLTSLTPAVCTVSVNTVTLLSAGTCNIAADQAGNNNYNAAPQVQSNVVVAKSAQTIAFGALAAKAVGDPAFTVTATATSGLPVVFSASTPLVCTVSGATVTLVAAGTCSIAADQAGDGRFAPAPRVTQSFAVTATQTIAFAPIAEHWLSDPPFAIGATATSGLPVTFSSLTLPVCTVSGNTVTVLTIGSCTIAADQGGNASVAAAPRVTQSFRVSGFLATGAMLQARSNHTATLLPDGRVLVAGGFNSSGAPTDTSEIYTPATGRFTTAGSLPSKSAGHTATLLNDGRVLAAGGGNSSAEIFSPATNTWNPAGGMGSTRSFHTATKLGNGSVLLAGGTDNAGKTIQSTIVFNPATGAFSNGPSMTVARERHTAALLSNGKVLIAGGRQKAGNTLTTLKSAELCDAASCTAVSGTMAQARYGHSVEFTSSGQLLVIGGADPSSTVAELFTGSGFATITSTAMRAARRDLGVSLLPDGRLLVTGGAGAAGVPQSSELFGSAFINGAKMLSAHSGHRSTRLPDGRVLITGGLGSTGVASSAAELFVAPPP